MEVILWGNSSRPGVGIKPRHEPSRPLLPQLELWELSRLDGAKQRGVLAEPATLHFARDAWGFMERHDVQLAAPLRVTWESGETQPLELLHGGVAANSLGTRTEGADLPGWLETPGRPGVRFTRVLPAGTHVEVTRAREGLDDARVHVRFLR